MAKNKQEKIEANNLKEEIREIISPCVKCGMCKSNCPIFKVLKEETSCPRWHMTLLSEEVYDKILFKCNLCQACEKSCPLGIKICDAIRKSREVLVLEGKELEGNKEMIKNIRETGNPSGKKEGSNDKLYCC